MHQDRVSDPGRYQRDAYLFLTTSGMHYGKIVFQQPDHGDRDGAVGTGNADLVVTFRNVQVTTPGSSTPGCSKKMCTSSHSTWYIVTWTSLTTNGSADRAIST